MTTEEARKNLHPWLEDLNALREFCDPNNPDMADFVVAWKVALRKAKEAARQYAEAIAP